LVACFLLGGLQRREAATVVDSMTRNLQTKAGAAIYAGRNAMVEPVFGQIKEARRFRRSLLRGYAKVQAEWALVCTAHNIPEVVPALPLRQAGTCGQERDAAGHPGRAHGARSVRRPATTARTR
jgi:hypothetical protein